MVNCVDVCSESLQKLSQYKRICDNCVKTVQTQSTSLATPSCTPRLRVKPRRKNSMNFIIYLYIRDDNKFKKKKKQDVTYQFDSIDNLH